ncbi:MAG: Undecaprenyl-phosphate 4-deoxy-4-formamido-L-arabinose transferase [Syntrophaceae bacterium PtaB.Bin038]|nr:MAG: Undecaprenyl-phosphate 4-deoxy-4-formamido-L-arabinose transferase [Syntrophaceae bacterium PtaB.Bin038]
MKTPQQLNRTPRPAALSVVVPVYNSETTLCELVARLGPVLAGTGAAYELILVNDGSRDESGRVIEELAFRHGWVRGIHLMRNFGQHNALLCGIRAARHDVIVTMDDDLQNPPEEIPKLLEKLGEGFDVVYGTPEERQQGIFRNWASRVTRVALQSSMGAETARHASAFRAFRTSLRDAFASYRSPFVSIDVLLTWGTGRFAAVRVDQRPRHSGQSNYTFRKLVVHALDMMTGFSTLPLQIASLTGFFFTLFGIAVLAYVLGRYALDGGSVPGFPFLASVIAIFAGAQLFALGIIGEYLARMHFRMMEKPTYVCRRGPTESRKENRWEFPENREYSARSMRKRS